MTTTTRPLPGSIFIKVHTYWDNVNGNPYSASTVYADGEHLATTARHYGSAEQEVYEAWQIIAKFYGFEYDGPATRQAREMGITLYTATEPTKLRAFPAADLTAVTA